MGAVYGPRSHSRSSRFSSGLEDLPPSDAKKFAKPLGFRPYEADDNPDIAFLMWIFTGKMASGHRHAGVMSDQQRIAWMKRNTPMTYALIANTRTWDDAFA